MVVTGVAMTESEPFEPVYREYAEEFEKLLRRLGQALRTTGMNFVVA
jgi:hypothetical protein